VRPWGMRPTSRSKRGFSWRHVVLGSGIVAAVLAYLAQPPTPPVAETQATPVRLSAARSPPPAWMPIERPLAIYGIDSPHLKPLPVAVSARRNAAGGREDSLAFGWFNQDNEAHLRVVVQRSTQPEPLDASLFLDLARRASGAGLAVIRSTPPERLATKFGLLETSEVTLSDSAERACLAFRFAHQEVGFRLVGWHCPSKGQAIDRKVLACTVDRLSLVEAGNDEPLKTVFAQADRQRIAECTPAPIVASADPRRGAKGSRQARPARTPAPVTAARTGSANPRGQARGAGNASPNSRG
jgi:hypothetical protein